jgi:hypothetical protein
MSWTECGAEVPIIKEFFLHYFDIPILETKFQHFKTQFCALQVNFSWFRSFFLTLDWGKPGRNGREDPQKQEAAMGCSWMECSSGRGQSY